MVLDDMRTEIYELKEKLKTAVQDEREARALIIRDKLFRYNTNQIALAGIEGALEDCIESIRARGEE